jgi:hypothetical protein
MRAPAGAAPSRRRAHLHLSRALRILRRSVQRLPLAWVLALVLLHVLLAMLTFEPRPHTGGDNAAYITLARSLLERGAYLELWDPAEAPHTKYPPVFPAVLALALLAGLQPWVQLKFVVLGFSAMAVACSFLWLRSRGRYAAAVGVAVLIAAAPGVLRESRWILSDVPFWAFSMIALWTFDRLRPHDWTRFAVAALAVILAYFTRSAGLPLLLAALAWLAWRRRWHQLAALSVVTVVPVALWTLRSRALAGGAYVSEFWLIEPYRPALGTIGPSDLLLRIVENVQKYVMIHLPTLLAGRPSLPALAASILIFGFALAGWIRHVRQPGRIRVSELFLPLYVGLIFVWPAVWSGERFLLPVLPLLLYYAADGVARIARRVAARHAFTAPAAATLLLLLLALPGLARGAQVGRECTGLYLGGERHPCLGGAPWNDFFRIAEEAGAVLPADAVVLNRKPRLLHVLSGGVKSRNYPLSPDPAAFFATADSAGARYVVFDQLDAVAEVYLRPVLIRRAGAFCIMLVREPTGTVLFGIAPDAASLPEVQPGELGPDGTVSFPLCGPEYWRNQQALPPQVP